MPWIDVDAGQLPELSEKERAEIERYAEQKKTRPRFYADENFPRQAVEILREWGFDVLAAREAGKGGHPDENHLALARRLGRILVTCDRDFLNERRFPLISSPTLIVFDFGNAATSEIVGAFECLVSITYFPQFYDKWCKIEATPGEWAEYMRFQDGSTSRDRFRWQEGRLQTWAEE